LDFFRQSLIFLNDFWYPKTKFLHSFRFESVKKLSCPLLELVSLRATQLKSEKIPKKEELESEKEIKRLKKLNSELYRQLAVKVLE